MSGNVFEWCWDWWPESGAYSADAVTNPRGDTSGSKRVFRGGSCFSGDASYCAVSIRIYKEPEDKSNSYGVRVCRNAN